MNLVQCELNISDSKVLTSDTVEKRTVVSSLKDHLKVIKYSDIFGKADPLCILLSKPRTEKTAILDKVLFGRALSF